MAGCDGKECTYEATRLRGFDRFCDQHAQEYDFELNMKKAERAREIDAFSDEDLMAAVKRRGWLPCKKCKARKCERCRQDPCNCSR